MPREDVEDVIQKHKQMKDFHEWLHMRKNRGDPMPETREELMQIYKIERPKFLQPKQHKKSYARHQVKYSLRRPYTWAAAVRSQQLKEWFSLRVKHYYHYLTHGQNSSRMLELSGSSAFIRKIKFESSDAPESFLIIMGRPSYF